MQVGKRCCWASEAFQMWTNAPFTKSTAVCCEELSNQDGLAKFRASYRRQARAIDRVVLKNLCEDSAPSLRGQADS